MYQLCIDSLIYIWYFYIIKFYDQTMKNLLLLPTLFTFVIGFSQTPITNGNFDAAIADCLATHPVTGLCVDSEYGPMPDWDVSNVTDMFEAFRDRTDFNANIGAWDVGNVT